MSKEQLDKLIDLMRNRPMPDPVTVETMRDRINEIGDKFPPPSDAKVDLVALPNCPAEWVSAPGADSSRQVLYLHGGGYVIGSPHSHRNLAYGISKAANAKVLLIDYRMAPEHPYPAAVEDAVHAYQWMLDQGAKPERTAIMGDSAGGGLTVATLVALKDEGIRLPACGVCLSPWVDLEGIGESMTRNAEADPSVRKDALDWFSGLYLNGADPHSPTAAPLYADLSGLPPLLIQVGTIETLFDDSKRLAEKARGAGVDVTYEEWEGMPHVWQLFAPILSEGTDSINKIGAWARERTA
jgi:epsilon-lactone hydrolase